MYLTIILIALAIAVIWGLASWMTLRRSEEKAMDPTDPSADGRYLTNENRPAQPEPGAARSSDQPPGG